MNLLRLIPFRFPVSALRFFANHAPDSAAELGFANQIALADGAAPEWVEVPFGNHDHKNGMQVFDRDAAERIVANFNLSKSPFFGGLPWYVGHPDVPEFANSYKDKTAQGWVKEMETTDTALRLRVKWNKRGEGIIANEEFKYFSPVWGCAPVPGKTRHFRPVRMKSVGFTNEPNIGVMPLSNANEATNQPTNIMDLKKLAAMLGLDPETATEESITAHLDGMKEKLAANEKPPLFVVKLGAEGKTEITLVNEADSKVLADEFNALDASLKKALAEIANEQTARTAADTAFANERKARIDLVLADAIRTGRITEAQREPWANELATAFDAKSVELANVKPAIHTSARTKNLGSRKETSDAAAKVVELANERMTQNGEDWTTAYRLTLKANPALAAQMQNQPAA